MSDRVSLNSMQSNRIGWPFSIRMFPRCRSPWQWRAKPSLARPSSSGRGAPGRCRSPAPGARRPGGPSEGQAAQQIGVGADRVAQGRDAAALRAQARAGVEARHRAAQRILQRVVDGPRLGGQHPVLVEAAHLQQVLDDLALAVELDAAVGRARQAAHLAIDVRRGGAVEGQLALQRPAPQLQRRVVQEAEIDRPLHLEGRAADQEHPGARGLDRVLRPVLEPGGHFLLARGFRVLDHAFDPIFSRTKSGAGLHSRNERPRPSRSPCYTLVFAARLY
jgi:hypothetical protein